MRLATPWRRAAIAAAAVLPVAAAIPAILPASAAVASFRMTGDAAAIQLYQSSLAPGTLNFDTVVTSSPVAATAVNSTPHADALASLLYVGGAVNGPAEALGGALLDAELGSAANPTPVRSSPVDISGVAPYTMFASSDSGSRVDDRGATPPVPGSAPPLHLNAAAYATHADRSPLATARVDGGGLSVDQLGVAGTASTQSWSQARSSLTTLRNLIAFLRAIHGDRAGAQASASTPTGGPFLAVGSENAASDGRQGADGAGESASATLGDISLLGGMLHIGSLTVAASGSTDGTRVPAPASGTATLADVTVAGMPATIDAHGVHVTGGGTPDVIAAVNGALGQALAGAGVAVTAGSGTTLQKTLGRPSTDYALNGLVVSYTVPGLPPVLLSLGHAHLFLGAQPLPQLSTAGFSAGTGSGAPISAATGTTAPAGRVPAPFGGGSAAGPAPAPAAAVPAPPTAPAPAATAPARIAYAAADVLGRNRLLTLAGLAEGLLLLACLLTGLSARRAPAAGGHEPDLLL